MKKLDDLSEDAFLGAFLQEKRKETGAPVKPAAAQKPKPVPAVIAPPPPVEDPQLVAVRAAQAADATRLADTQKQLAERDVALAEARATLADVARERRQLDQRLTEAQARTRGLEAMLQAADTKASLWSQRGLEKAEALQALGLLAVEAPQLLLEATMAVAPEPLARLLNDRLALLCDAADCQPATRDTVVLRVPAARCELCGGSDLRQAFRAFAKTMAAKQLTAVSFIGGSPAYREALRQLSRELKPNFELDTVAQKRPNEGKRAQATRGLVVIWGGTEVDHDTTTHYRDAGDLVLIVSHRGLSGMLPRLTTMLAKH